MPSTCSSMLSIMNFMLGKYLCDNIGLVLACLLSGSTHVAASPSQYMTQSLASLSCLLYILLCMLAIPIHSFLGLLLYLYNIGSLGIPSSILTTLGMLQSGAGALNWLSFFLITYMYTCLYMNNVCAML